MVTLKKGDFDKIDDSPADDIKEDLKMKIKLNERYFVSVFKAMMQCKIPDVLCKML